MCFEIMLFLLIICIQELFYFMFVLSMTLIIPLLVMLVSYIAIIIQIYKRSKQSQIFGGGVMHKAKFNTIKATGVLVLGFILCWTPYYHVHMVDKLSKPIISFSLFGTLIQKDFTILILLGSPVLPTFCTYVL